LYQGCQGVWLERGWVWAGYAVGMKDFFVADAVRFDNSQVTSYFVLSSMQVREKKQGGQFLALVLTDKTGSFEARMWDDRSFGLHAGDAVRRGGDVGGAAGVCG
jgi:hypothetical protein